jgi:PHD/YefM family antitoxin component YafN of YafNO toxin-antitoxin module
MIKLDDIHSLTDFQRDAKSHIKQLKKTGRPVVLTVNGKATLVVQDASAYQSMLDSVDRAEAIAGIQRSLESMEREEGESAAKAFDRIRKKHGVPVE